ncbi:MAG TPA: hypothetical protein GX513_12525 [Firmicutes bacterium]|nr:hypothetical protein [Bacillota bacterium]
MRQGHKGLYSVGSHPMAFWFVLLPTMLLKYGYYGLRYFPVLDDNNMYGIFAMMAPADALSHYRWYTTRPLAGLLDAFVWSRLWACPSLVFLIMILLHFFAIVLLWKVFQKNNLRAGMVAAVLFALLPLGTEATYWIAASSRLVVGLFCASLSLYLLALYLEKVKRKEAGAALRLGGFWLTNLISLGFYEQVIAFSFAGAILLLLANSRLLRKPHGRMAFPVPFLLSFINLTVIGLWYKAFSHLGNVATRGQLVTGNYLGHTVQVLRGIQTLLGPYQWQMLKAGTGRGLELILADRAYLYLLLALAASTLLAVLAAREMRAWQRPSIGAQGKTTGVRPAVDLLASAAEFTLGALLVFLPFAPFFLLKDAWIYNRSAFLSLLGLSLMAEALVNGAVWAAGRGRLLAILRGALLGALVFGFLLANTAEVAAYREVSLSDKQICQEFIGAAEKAAPDWDSKEILLFNAKPVYARLTGNHFTNCTASDWALMGAVQVTRGNRRIGHIYPVPEGGQFVLPQQKLQSSPLYLGIDDRMTVFPLSGKWIETTRDGATLELRKADGNLFGKATPAADDRDQFCFSLAKP